MRCDNKMKEKVGEIRKICESYLEYINDLNECAYSDRMLEKITDSVKELEAISNRRFKSNMEENNNMKR